MRSTNELPEGYQYRGMVIRLYPTQSQIEQFRIQQNSLRVCWNWLVGRKEEVIKAAEAWCVRNGFIDSRDKWPRKNDATATQLRSYHAQRSNIVHEKMKTESACAWRPSLTGPGSEAERLGLKYDYQVLQWLLKSMDLPIPPANVLQALIKNYSTIIEGQRKKRFKDEASHVPLQTRSGRSLSITNHKFYNGEVRFPGVPDRIRARLDKGLLKIIYKPGSGFLEGVTIKEEADGWYASVKYQHRVVSIQRVPGTFIGIDPGLDNLVATSQPILLPGHDKPTSLVKNNRDIEFIDRVAGMQQRMDNEVNLEKKERLQRQIARIHQKHKRFSRNLCFNISKSLEKYEHIGIEKINKTNDGIGCKQISSTGILTDILKIKHGDRVHEISSAFTSQDCSQCGTRDKETWAKDGGGPIKECKSCGFRCNRDINSSFNLEKRLKIDILLAS